MTSVQRRSLVRRALSIGYLLAVAIVLFFTFRSDWAEVSEQLRSISPVAVLGALVLAACGLACSVAAWIIVIRSLGEAVGVGPGARIFLVSQTGKYLPGSVWAAVAQVQMGRAVGVGRRANLASFVIALALAMVSGAFVGAVGWATLEPSRWLVVGPLMVIAGAVGVIAFRRWPEIICRVPDTVRRRLPDRRPSAGAMSLAMAVLCVGWVLNGLQFYVVADALGIDADALALRAISAYALAFVGGLLFVVAPAGAGVREGLLVLLLGSSTTLGVVTAAALVSRFVVTIVDVLAALLGLVLGRGHVTAESGSEQRVSMPLSQEEGVERGT